MEDDVTVDREVLIARIAVAAENLADYRLELLVRIAEAAASQHPLR